MSLAKPTTVEQQLVLGRYRVIRRLAQGGMGVVYLGRIEGAAGFCKAVIIKRVIPDVEDLEQSTARFIREAQILSHLQHPGIVGVLDFGQEEQGYAMVLEYVHGYDLGRWLKYLHVTSQRMHWEEAAFITLRVLEALSYAHTFRRADGTAAGILHRDISPGNILLDLEGQVRLLDFGIARMAEEDMSQYKTEEGVLKGKVPFLAPELFASSPPSTSSDIYACAVVLYQMLAGTHPFAADNESQVLRRVLTEPPRALSALRDDLPARLEETVLACLEKAPGERLATAADFAQALRHSFARSETQILAGLRQRLRADFSGPMPAQLRLEPLDERDRAWRMSHTTTEEEAAPLRSSRAPLHVYSLHPTVAVGRREPVPPPRAVHLPEVSPESTVTSVERPEPAGVPRKQMVMLGAGMATLLVLVALGALAFMTQRTEAPAAGRFIVVERPDAPARRDEPVVVAAAHGEESVADESPVTVGPQKPPRPVLSPRSENTKSRADESARALSEVFAARQGLLQACFERFAAELHGRPEIAVQFDVAASGRVTSATLSPATLDGTPLGHCLLTVARQTSFGAQAKPIRFTIPIHARAVNK